MPKRHLERYVLAALVALTAPGCQQDAPVAHQAASAPTLTGRILPEDRAIAAALADIANGATVSLIDSTTGRTVTTTVSSSTGAFSLYTTSAFAPVEGRPYYLEAAKGLPMGGEANRAGASIARMRTILFYQGESWLSLASAIPGSSIAIGWATTAVSVIASLRSLSAGHQLNLIGRVNGRTFDPTGTVLNAAEFSTVYGLVDAAVRGDQDPLEVISYDPDGISAATKYGKAPGPLVIHDAFSPATTIAGGTATFTGQNFPLFRPDVAVAVGDMPVSSWTVNADRSQLSIILGPNAFGGLLTLTQGSSSWLGPYLPIRGTVGTLAGNGLTGDSDGRGIHATIDGPTGITVDAAGNLIYSDINTARIRKITPAGVVTTLAGDGSQGSVDGTGTAARLTTPYGVDIDGAGNMYVAEYGAHKIRKISPSLVVTTLAGTGATGAINGAAASATFFKPVAVTVDPAGNLYVAEWAGNLIRKISSAGVVTTYAGTGTAGSADGPAASAQFSSPAGLALDAAGNLYVADCSSGKLRKITAGGGTVSTVNATPLSGPFSVALDAAGNAYVACRNSNTIQKVTPAGVVTTVAGSGTAGFADGATSSAQFNAPQCVKLVGNNLYVTEYPGRRIRVITL